MKVRLYDGIRRRSSASMNRTTLAFAAALIALGASIVLGQRGDPVTPNHPAIEYATRETSDPIAALNRRLAAGEVQLTFDPATGYLRSVLDALKVPVESQMLVFSETSLQSEFITEKTPRSIFFSDNVAVGWVRAAETLEVTAVDPQQGSVFYQIDQKAGGPQRFTRASRCLECHLSPSNTSNVPGLFVMSMLPMTDDPNEYAVGWMVDHRTPIVDRWGGWYVTGKSAPRTHLGNVPVYHVKESQVRRAVAPKLESVREAFDATSYLTPYSDVVALLVLNHQGQMTNLMTRLHWVTRIAQHDRKVGSLIAAPATAGGTSDPVDSMASELVDYLLFADEAPLSGKVEGSSGFAEKFSALAPSDQKGRSLRHLDLERRLLKYPCSYMIYSDAFDALPASAKGAVYDRMWKILSGQDTDSMYARLTLPDRQAIVEILRETKKDLPAYFQPVTK